MPPEAFPNLVKQAEEAAQEGLQRVLSPLLAYWLFVYWFRDFARKKLTDFQFDLRVWTASLLCERQDQADVGKAVRDRLTFPHSLGHLEVEVWGSSW